jgi:hypothetical protein
MWPIQSTLPHPVEAKISATLALVLDASRTSLTALGRNVFMPAGNDFMSKWNVLQPNGQVEACTSVPAVFRPAFLDTNSINQ